MRPRKLRESYQVSPQTKSETINQEPSQDEFVRLLAAHSSKLMSFIRIITMNRQDDAEEVFQRTCFILWKKFSQFDGENFLAWACSVARFEMLKHQESKNRFILFDDETTEYLAAAALPIACEAADRRAALVGCLKKLPLSDSQLIRHKYFDGLSVKDIALRVGRSTHRVYRDLARIHGVLSKCIDRSLADETVG